MVFSLPFNNFSLHILVFSLLITLGNLELPAPVSSDEVFVITGYLQNSKNSPKTSEIACSFPDKQGI